MNEFQIALLMGAILTALISGVLPMARLWILAGAVSFVASVIWAGYSMPYPPFFNVMADAIVCLLIYFGASEKWELKLYNIFQLSILLNLMRLAGVMNDNYLYGVMLELCNWAALALIAVTAILARMRDDTGALDHSRLYFRRIGHSLRGARAKASFHKVKS